MTTNSTSPSVTLYQNRSTGFWYANVYWADTKQRQRFSLSVSIDDDPTIAFEEFKKKVVPGLVSRHRSTKEEAKEPAGQSISKLCDWFVDTHLDFKGSSPKTVTKYSSLLRRFELFCRDRRIGRAQQLNMAIIQDFLVWEDSRGEKKAQKTKAGHVGILRTWLNACIDSGLLDESPIRKWMMPSVPEPEPKALEWSEVLAAVESVRESDPEIWPIIQFIAWTGFRPSDAIDLKWSQVHKSWILRPQEKTNRPIKIPITKPVQTALDAAGPRSHEGNVFTTPEGKPWPHRTLLRRFKAAGGRPYLTLKLLRTSFCTHLARSGCNPKLHMHLMGHADLETTLRYYTEVDFKMAENFMSELVSASNGKPAKSRVTRRKRENMDSSK